MTDLKAQRNMAAKILKRGNHGVWIDSDKIFNVASAITRDDIKTLIRNGTIKPRKIQGTSRGRARALTSKRRRGQRSGPGKRKGTQNARFGSKRAWINKIRKQRKYLRELRDEGYSYEEITKE